MLRVLRKYNRTLLAVFGSGIMIVFLLGNADIVGYFSGLGGQSSWVAKFGDGREISRQDYAVIQNELRVINALTPPLQPLPIVGDISRDVDVFIQLAHEAQQAGMVGGAGSLPIGPDEALSLAQQTGHNPAVIRSALSTYFGIDRYLRWVMRSGMLSDNRLVREGRRQLEGADVQLVVLPAKADDAAAPTPEELQAHFDAWKDTVPGEGDHGFGYRLPDRATVEWLVIPRASVEAGIRAAVADDDTDVRMFWRRNEGRFPAIEGATEVPAEVTDAFVRESADKRLGDLERHAADALRLPRRGFESTDGVVTLPDNWNELKVPFADLRADLIESFDLPADDVVQPASIDTLTAIDEIGADDTFRFAGTERFGPTSEGRPRWAVTDLLGALNEFGGGLVPLQADITLPVMTTPTGDRIFMRATSAEGDRAPHDLAEVLTQVDTDLRRKAAYDALLASQDDIAGEARDNGLDALAESWATEVNGPTSMQRNFAPGLPRPARIAGLEADDADVVGTVIDESIALGADTLSDLDASERIVVVPSDRNLALVVVRLDRRVPVSDAQWTSMIDNGQMIYMAAADDFGGADLPDLRAAFTAEAMAARHGYERSGGDEEEDDDTLDATADASN